MKIFKSVKNAGTPEVTVSSDNFVQIDKLDSISVKVKKDSQLLITLTVPDTWCDTAGKGAWFAIQIDKKSIVARGLYTCGIKGQRVPIVLQALVDITSDSEVEVVAQWHSIENATCNIGSASETVLTVLVNDEQSQNEMLEAQIKKYLQNGTKGGKWPF